MNGAKRNEVKDLKKKTEMFIEIKRGFVFKNLFEL